MHKLYLTNEDKLEIEIDDLNLEGIFRDSIVRPHLTDPTKMQIAARNKRGNRGISLGYTGGHSLWKDKVTGIAEPQIVVDTWRYVPVAKKFTNLQRLMASEAGFELIDEALFPDIYYNSAQRRPSRTSYRTWTTVPGVRRQAICGFVSQSLMKIPICIGHGKLEHFWLG
jgi:hypothetical protein